MIKYLFAFVALIASVPVGAIAYDLTRVLIEDWRKPFPFAVNTWVGAVICASLWILVAYASTSALYLFFGGAA